MFAQTLERAKRLRKRKDFLRVQKYGRRIFSQHFVVLTQKLRCVDTFKIGITVPKKVGPAHERNRLKRRVRHVVRLNQEIFKNLELVVVARPSANCLSFENLSTDLLSACQKIRRISS